MHACITHQLKKSKPFCASFVVQSAAMQTPMHSSELDVHLTSPTLLQSIQMHMAGADAWQEQMHGRSKDSARIDGCTALRRRKAFRAGNAPYLEVTVRCARSAYK